MDLLTNTIIPIMIGILPINILNSVGELYCEERDIKGLKFFMVQIAFLSIGFCITVLLAFVIFL
ncbi:hypothetical protein [Vagococcus fessus]|uniref:Uncharacterized protein n=1 Tax=Vagococcus fessus TaxID=120370 RepID=A0A430A568_9ENTE|nr:hypothetical protein [Vagococcus fessus]RSU01950.1 hypothetical protein CBF31_09285 [Vagococcus fessus]